MECSRQAFYISKPALEMELNRIKQPHPEFNGRFFDRNRPVAGIDCARSAIEFIVNAKQSARTAFAAGYANGVCAQSSDPFGEASAALALRARHPNSLRSNKGDSSTLIAPCFELAAQSGQPEWPSAYQTRHKGGRNDRKYLFSNTTSKIK